MLSWLLLWFFVSMSTLTMSKVQEPGKWISFGGIQCPFDTLRLWSTWPGNLRFRCWIFLIMCEKLALFAAKFFYDFLNDVFQVKMQQIIKPPVSMHTIERASSMTEGFCSCCTLGLSEIGRKKQKPFNQKIRRNQNQKSKTTLLRQLMEFSNWVGFGILESPLGVLKARSRYQVPLPGTLDIFTKMDVNMDVVVSWGIWWVF